MITDFCQQSVFKRYHGEKRFSEFFAYMMATKVNWHRYGTKLRHYRHMYRDLQLATEYCKLIYECNLTTFPTVMRPTCDELMFLIIRSNVTEVNYRLRPQVSTQSCTK